MLNFCDFIQVFVFTTNHHLKHTGSSTPSREMQAPAPQGYPNLFQYSGLSLEGCKDSTWLNTFSRLCILMLVSDTLSAI